MKNRNDCLAKFDIYACFEITSSALLHRISAGTSGGVQQVGRGYRMDNEFCIGSINAFCDPEDNRYCISVNPYCGPEPNLAC